MTRRTFYEPIPGYVSHTANSAAVAKDSSLSAWIGHNVDEVGRAVTFLGEAIDKWGDTEDPSETAMCLAFGLPEGGTIFDFLQNDGNGEKMGWRAKRFGLAMSAMSKTGSFSSAHLHTGFDWPSLGEATLVDVCFTVSPRKNGGHYYVWTATLTKLQIGGSAGHDDIELARHHPGIKFIIQDRAEVVASFKDSLPSNLHSRISFQTHDFMSPQPVKGADVYFLKHIRHDWPDVMSVKIVQMIVLAMTPFENGKGSRLLIMDAIMPEIGEVPLTSMQLNTAMDIQMMAVMSAKERSRADWKALLLAADPRLRIANIKQPVGGRGY
jgi:hypothetical protein